MWKNKQCLCYCILKREMGHIGSERDNKTRTLADSSYFLQSMNFSFVTIVSSSVCDSLIMIIFSENLCYLAWVYQHLVDWSQTIDHAAAIKSCFNRQTQNHLYGENSINFRHRQHTTIVSSNDRVYPMEPMFTNQHE